MKINVYTLFLFLGFLACNTATEEESENQEMKPDRELAFDETKWKTKEGSDYPFRDKMLNDVIHNDSIRSLNKDEILFLLGEPDRSNENYLYYMITRKRLVLWTLHSKTMVIKFDEDNDIEWIKIHE